MCYERRRAEACVDHESAHHALANAGGRDGTREEPGTLTQGAPVFPGSSRSSLGSVCSSLCVCQFFIKFMCVFRLRLRN
jgi:hypothetical protein